jgi:chromosome segregation ATPase
MVCMLGVRSLEDALEAKRQEVVGLQAQVRSLEDSAEAREALIQSLEAQTATLQHKLTEAATREAALQSKVQYAPASVPGTRRRSCGAVGGDGRWRR